MCLCSNENKENRGARWNIILQNWSLFKSNNGFCGESYVVESNTKVNANYYCNILLKKVILEMNRLAKHNDYLFMQGRARTHTGKLTFEMLKYKKQLW